MTINLRPELEQLIRQDVERGPYKSVDEFLETAIQMLHEQEEWLETNRLDIAARIEEGYAAARRGELIDSDQVQSQLKEKKAAWRDERRRP
jgi:putative addiction module CopG family antidote